MKESIKQTTKVGDNNYRDGYNVRSAHWKKYKESLPNILPEELFEACVGIMLGDGTLYKSAAGAKLKLEQGPMHKEYLFHLHSLFESWTFYKTPASRVQLNPLSGDLLVKSYYFRTFSHPAFLPLWELFMATGRKAVKPRLVLDHLTALGLCYWVADDGSFHRDGSLTLHTQGFTERENLLLCAELNDKFGIHAFVVVHKKKYWVIKIPAKSVQVLKPLLKLPKGMEGKLRHSLAGFL